MLKKVLKIILLFILIGVSCYIIYFNELKSADTFRAVAFGVIAIIGAFYICFPYKLAYYSNSLFSIFNKGDCEEPSNMKVKVYCVSGIILYLIQFVYLFTII